MEHGHRRWNRRGRGHAKTSHRRNVGEPFPVDEFGATVATIPRGHTIRAKPHIHTNSQIFDYRTWSFVNPECGDLEEERGIFCSVLHMYKHPSSGFSLPLSPSENRKQIWPAAVIWCSLMNLGGFHAAKLANDDDDDRDDPIYTIVSPPGANHRRQTTKCPVPSRPVPPFRPSEKPF